MDLSLLCAQQKKKKRKIRARHTRAETSPEGSSFVSEKRARNSEENRSRLEERFQGNDRVAALLVRSAASGFCGGRPAESAGNIIAGGTLEISNFLGGKASRMFLREECLHTSLFELVDAKALAWQKANRAPVGGRVGPAR